MKFLYFLNLLWYQNKIWFATAGLGTCRTSIILASGFSLRASWPGKLDDLNPLLLIL